MTLKRCISFLTTTTTPKKLETYYPLCTAFAPNTPIYPQKAKHFWIFFSTSEGRAAKNKCLVEKKTKGSDSYAISSAKFTTEAIATPAVLDTCTAGTMEHDKHPLTIYCSVQADTRTWNWWQLQFLSCCINAISTKPAMHLIQASICQTKPGEAIRASLTSARSTTQKASAL